MTPGISENLGNGAVVNEDGDVCSEDDVVGRRMSNEHRIARMHPHNNPEEEWPDTDDAADSGHDRKDWVDAHAITMLAFGRNVIDLPQIVEDGFMPQEQASLIADAAELYKSSERLRAAVRRTRGDNQQLNRFLMSDTFHAAEQKLKGAMGVPDDDNDTVVPVRYALRTAKQVITGYEEPPKEEERAQDCRERQFKDN